MSSPAIAPSPEFKTLNIRLPAHYPRPIPKAIARPKYQRSHASRESRLCRLNLPFVHGPQSSSTITVIPPLHYVPPTTICHHQALQSPKSSFRRLILLLVLIPSTTHLCATFPPWKNNNNASCQTSPAIPPLPQSCGERRPSFAPAKSSQVPSRNSGRANWRQTAKSNGTSIQENLILQARHPQWTQVLM